jgi:hypothetical protein
VSIVFKLNLFGWHVGDFDIRIDIDESAVSVSAPVVEGAVKRMSRRWAHMMTS